MANPGKSEAVRSAVMGVFRRWGGHWNVTIAPVPEAPEGEREWELVVHSRHVISGTLSEGAVDSLLRGDDESQGLWERELRALFQKAWDASHAD